MMPTHNSFLPRHVQPPPLKVTATPRILPTIPCVLPRFWESAGAQSAAESREKGRILVLRRRRRLSDVRAVRHPGHSD